MSIHAMKASLLILPARAPEPRVNTDNKVAIAGGGISRTAVLLLGCTAALLLALSWRDTEAPSTAVANAGTALQPPEISVSAVSAGTRDPLDSMRMHALAGNELASLELARILMRRYELAGKESDLHEAFYWIALDWDRPEVSKSAVVQLAVLSHCEHPVLKWHWLCVAGE